MTDQNWNQLIKKSAKLDKAKAAEFGLFSARLLRPFFMDFCEKCEWPFAERFDHLLLNGRELLRSRNISERDTLEIIPDTDKFAEVIASYATYAGLALHSALFQPSGPDSVNFVWSVTDLIEYNAGSEAAEHVWTLLDTALKKLEEEEDLGDLNPESISW